MRAIAQNDLWVWVIAVTYVRNVNTNSSLSVEIDNNTSAKNSHNFLTFNHTLFDGFYQVKSMAGLL